ncbi:hypothetical protein AB205_0124720 [Aquarana catesbeiana]|uniref:Uncharacterized protein n=1 Tax=Aquarana catesbeiana TaxID=8400 RepID=A0A2G9S4C7_AQUCT|nr:hypothetical protein AB205_0124720 [Aquarana catesbeiana]
MIAENRLLASTTCNGCHQMFAFQFLMVISGNKILFGKFVPNCIHSIKERYKRIPQRKSVSKVFHELLYWPVN